MEYFSEATLENTLAERDYVAASRPIPPRREFLIDRDHVAASWPVLPRREFLVDPSEIVFEFRLGKETLLAHIVGENFQDWLFIVVARLNELSILRENWDGYGALPVSQDTLEYALSVAVQIFDQDGGYRVPQIGSTAAGGIEFEWHDSDRDLEVEIECPGRIVGYYYGGTSDDEWEGVVSDNLSELKPYLDLLATV